jgi:hypothetical protein
MIKRNWWQILLGVASIGIAVFVKNSNSKRIATAAEEAAAELLRVKEQFSQPRPTVSE